MSDTRHAYPAYLAYPAYFPSRPVPKTPPDTFCPPSLVIIGHGHKKGGQDYVALFHETRKELEQSGT